MFPSGLEEHLAGPNTCGTEKTGWKGFYFLLRFQSARDSCHTDPGGREDTCGVHAFPHFWCYRSRAAAAGGDQMGDGSSGAPLLPAHLAAARSRAGLGRADPDRQWGAPVAVPAEQPDPAPGGARGHLGGGGDTGAHGHRGGRGGGDTRQGR